MTIKFTATRSEKSWERQYLRNQEGYCVICEDPILACGADPLASTYEMTISTQPFKGSKQHFICNRDGEGVGHLRNGYNDYLFSPLQALLLPLCKGKGRFRIYFYAEAV